jgi:hypothetical protein
MATKIQLRRDTASDWTSTNPTLAAGEFGWESDTNKFKIGDGATAWNSLAYASDGDTAGITFVGDDSTGTLVSQNETFKVAGTQNVTTAVSGDTLTVTGPDLSSYITASSTDTLTNKTFDANGTGNSISNIETSDIAAATLVTAADTIASNNNDTTIPTSAAVKAYADSVGGGGGGTITALNNQAENRLVSIGATTTELDGEANLTFDGSTLTLTGSAALDGVTIADNLITTNRSNDSLFIGSNGTGRIELSTDGGQLDSSTTYPKYHFASNRAKGVVLSRETSTDIDALTGREYGHVLHYGTTVTNGSTSNSNWNPRSVIFSSHTNMDGESYTNASNSRGPVGLFTAGTANNGSGSSASTLYNLRGSVTNAGIADYDDAPTQNMTIDRCIATESAVMIETTGTSTNTITDAYNFYSGGYIFAAAGNTNSITNLYGYYHGSSHGTNNYAFYDATNSLSVFGDIQTQGVSITDNLITTNRSNDNLYIQANGTGRVNMGDVKLEEAAYWSDVFGPASRIKGNALTYEDLAVNPNDLTDRELGHAIYQGTRITASSTNSNFRPRALLVGSVVHLDGFSYTNTNNFRGPLGAQIYGAVTNGTGTAVTCNTVRGVESSASVTDFTNTSGDITVVDSIGNFCANYHERNGTGDINITNDYGYKFAPEAYNSGGTGVTTVTNSYAFHCQANSGTGTVTNAYAFYSTDATASSRMGAIRLDNQSGDPTHGADFSWIFAKDEASSSEVFVKDEAGNVTKISPHNAAGEWEYYSKNSKTGKTVRINMEKLVAEVEKLSGKTFIESE